MDMSGFTKLFNSILHSTIWSEPNHVRILWITMLAMANKDGDVAASVPGLAKMAGITLEETEDALARFQQPDKYSRTPDFEGRRIKPTEGGWHLLNHGKYRALMSAEERREYNRRKQAERRAKLSKRSNSVNDSQSSSAMSAHTEAEAEANTPIVPKGTDADFLESVWKATTPQSRNRSSREKLADAWSKTRNKPDHQTVLRVLALWARCHDWTKDGGQFAPGIHRWIKERKWESEPESGQRQFQLMGRGY